MTHIRPVLAALVVALFAASAGTAAAATIPFTVIARGLHQPKKLTLTSSGSLIVALSGDGKAPSSCTDGLQTSCLDRSGAIAEVSPRGHVTTLLPGLASISSGADDPQATGPVEATLTDGTLRVLFQNTKIDATTGTEIFGSAGRMLGALVRFKGSSAGSLQARLGPFEAIHNPDRGAGTDVSYGEDSAIASDPYGYVAYHGGYAVADAAANDVLLVSHSGKVSVLAVLPTIRERAAAKTYGSSQTSPIEAQAQPVPTAVAVGPDGALYVGELGGSPFDPGTEDVYRLVPGHAPTVYARGLTAVGDIGFDARGRLLVLELDRKGIGDPGLNDGHPASGELIRIARSGTRTVLAQRGLVLPTGMAVAARGDVYVSDYGAPDGSGHTGEIIELHGS